MKAARAAATPSTAVSANTVTARAVRPRARNRADNRLARVEICKRTTRTTLVAPTRSIDRRRVIVALLVLEDLLGVGDRGYRKHEWCHKSRSFSMAPKGA